MDTNEAGEQLEEGEIVDDDFEAISDNSIIEPSFGKFVSSNEHLRALSLSSDSEYEILRQIKHKKKLLRRHRSRRQRKRYRVQSDTSDSDDLSPRHDLKGKLKEAIHISGIETTHRSTLENKLKAMGGLVIRNEREVIPETPQNETKEDKHCVDKIDEELENLRIEALKTAVLNKYQKRKRKKMASEYQEEKAIETLENKENDTPKDEQSDKKNGEKVEVNNAVADIEEDEDVLRASLLAGLARKIAKKTIPNEALIQSKQIIPRLPAQIVSALPKIPVTNFKKKIINTQNNNNILKKQMIHKITRIKPQVKPLIININDDSDTEEDIKPKDTQPLQKNIVQTLPQKVPEMATQKNHISPQKESFKNFTNMSQKNTAKENLPTFSAPKKSQTADLNIIQNNVEKFLKEQRAKFETETQKKIQAPNKDQTPLEKSAVKLLPKSRQIEYQELLKRLENAEKRKRAKKLAFQNAKNDNHPKANGVTAEACSRGPTLGVNAPPKAEVVQPILEQKALSDGENGKLKVKESSNEHSSKSDTSYSDKIKTNKHSDTSEIRSKITSELTTLQKTLKDIKMQGNGSLQIKSQYQVLTPVIRKITETSNKRKKQEQRIKELLQEIGDARKHLTRAHEEFSNLVRELVSKKEQIDKSRQQSKTVDKNRDSGNVTGEVRTTSVDKSNENIADSKKDSRSAPVTSTPIKTQIRSYKIDEPSASAFGTNSTIHDCEDMDVCNSDETDIYQIDIVDPNDIDQIFKRRPPIKPAIPEYVSPLNFNSYGRYGHVDPLGIMCPYEVNGSCRDTDCTYKHYLQNHERL